jgi:putative ABC transport system permease protein
MKELFSPLKSAWTSFITHKLRSFLTVLGILIGIAAVIILMSVGKGTEATMLSNFSSLGTNTVYVSPGSTSSGGVRSASGSATTLTYEDAEAIEESVSGIDAVAPYSSSSMQVIADSENMFARVTGATVSYKQVVNLEMASGEFITQSQYDRKQKVAVIGPDVATTLFGDEDPVGQTFRSSTGNVFTVIGVLESKGSSMMGSTDEAIIIPLSTLQGLMSKSLTSTGEHTVSSITLQVTEKDLISDVKEQITLLLEDRHDIALGADDDFTVTSMDDLLSSISSSMESLTLMLGAVAGISLLVGGIGVMNIMLVSVLERRREIGIKKALGALERDIWGQFLVDSALLSFLGGLLGVIFGWGGSFIINKLGLMTTLVTGDIVILAVVVSVAIGLFFGFYPAWMASRLDPIQALRAE